MTVICAAITAAGGAIVAADSQTTKTSGEKFPAPKLRRLARGRGIVAAAGDDVAVQIFLDWMDHGADVTARPYIPQKYTWEGMLVTRDKIFDYGGTAPFPDLVKRPFHAIGIGADAAMAVLAYQAQSLLELDPRAAVAAVCEVHADCGGPVDFLTLRPPKARQ